MYIHKEGFPTILISILFGVALTLGVYYLAPSWILLAGVFSIVFILFILSFFRNPTREIPKLDNNLIYAPADGKVVVIEKTFESEYLKEDCWQISIFMSPLNVHVNRHPVNGSVSYEKYHKGKYLVAWHPKSSTLNERHTTAYKVGNHKLLIRQIAGALARRIVNYTSAGDTAIQGNTMGFIKFGSRVDIFVPLNATIEVKKDQVVKGNLDVIARFTNG